MPRAPNHWVPPKSPNNVTNFFFNTVHLLPKDLKFEHGGAKLVSCPRRNLTSVRPFVTVRPLCQPRYAPFVSPLQVYCGLFAKILSLVFAPELIFFW